MHARLVQTEKGTPDRIQVCQPILCHLRSRVRTVLAASMEQRTQRTLLRRSQRIHGVRKKTRRHRPLLLFRQSSRITRHLHRRITLLPTYPGVPRSLARRNLRHLQPRRHPGTRHRRNQVPRQNAKTVRSFQVLLSGTNLRRNGMLWTSQHHLHLLGTQKHARMEMALGSKCLERHLQHDRRISQPRPVRPVPRVATRIERSQ